MNKNTKIKIAVSSAIGLVVIHNGIQLGKRYKLQRDYLHISKIDIKKNLVTLNVTTIDNSKLDRMPYSKNIKNFIDVLDKESNLDLTTCYYNLPSLEIQKKSLRLDNLIHHNGLEAVYEPDSNLIVLDNEEGIYHELFHMVSAIYDEKNGYCFSGFCQMYKGNFIGYGLDEGYTQYLTEYYFKENCESDSKVYAFEKLIARKLEELIGKPFMERLYSHGDLYGIVTKLKEYVKEEEIILSLQRLDFISRYANNKEYCDNYQFCMECMQDVVSFLIKVYCNKMINKDNFKIEDVYSFSKDFMKGIYNGNILLKYLNEKNVSNIFHRTRVKVN